MTFLCCSLAMWMQLWSVEDIFLGGVCVCMCVHACAFACVCVCFCCIDMGEYQCLAILFLFLFNVYSENVHPSFLHQTIEIVCLSLSSPFKKKKRKSGCYVKDGSECMVVQ